MDRPRPFRCSPVVRLENILHILLAGLGSRPRIYETYTPPPSPPRSRCPATGITLATVDKPLSSTPLSTHVGNGLTPPLHHDARRDSGQDDK